MKYFSIFLLFFFSKTLFSQELNCQVNVIVDNKVPATTVDLEIIEQMKQTIYELMNNTAWTKDKFKVEERINCNFQFQITAIPSVGNFVGSLQIQVTRPAFNSSYNTTSFNFQDMDLNIGFSRNAVLVYAPINTVTI
jgi:hypothetical protein